MLFFNYCTANKTHGKSDDADPTINIAFCVEVSILVTCLVLVGKAVLATGSQQDEHTHAVIVQQ